MSEVGIFLMIVVALAYTIGFNAGRRTHGNFRPRGNEDFDPTKPPPWPLGGSVGKKPPTIIHIYQRGKR